MPTHGSLDPRTPVVVAVGQVEQRADGPADALEPTALFAEAARAAQADAGTDRLLDAVDTLAAIRIVSWRYRDPAALVARDLGISPGRTIETDDGGNYPLSLLHRFAREIQEGRADVVLVGGGEAWRTRTASRSGGHDLPWTTQGDDVSPTEAVRNPDNLAHPGEWARGVMLPIEIYTLFENAHRAAQGWTIDEHRDRLAQLWSRFSEVAAGNLHAWIRRTFTPAELRDPSPDNRMVGFPYTKRMNANAAVEQAAAFVVCSVEKARSLGISTDRWVFPWGGAGAHEHWFVSNRWSLAEAPAVRLAGQAALDLVGAGIDDLAHVDLYSCFPSAVQIAARELGLGADRQLTVTGGLSFAGGPWNNYVSHSIAAMVDRLRGDAGSLGLVSGNGGFLTKHEIGLFSTEPPADPFRRADAQAGVDVLPQRDLAEEVDGAAQVETAVVMHDREGAPERALASTLLPDGRRAWANTTEPDALRRILTEETAGAAVHVDPAGHLTFS